MKEDGATQLTRRRKLRSVRLVDDLIDVHRQMTLDTLD